MAECVPSKWEVLGSMPSTAERKKRKRKREGRGGHGGGKRERT